MRKRFIFAGIKESVKRWGAMCSISKTLISMRKTQLLRIDWANFAINVVPSL